MEGYIEDLYRTWWSNGQLRSEGYSYAGVNEGKHKTWYENGKLILEIGFDQKEKVKNILNKKGFYINRVLKDLAKNDRCIISTKI